MLSACAHCNRLVDADSLKAVTLIEGADAASFPLAAMEMPTALAASDDRFLVSCDLWCPDCLRELGED
jgi:hypothetical protein